MSLEDLKFSEIKAISCSLSKEEGKFISTCTIYTADKEYKIEPKALVFGLNEAKILFKR